MGIFGGAGVLVPLVLWALLTALLAWMPAYLDRHEARAFAVRTVTAEDVLRRRLARGEISAREFEEALHRTRNP